MERLKRLTASSKGIDCVLVLAGLYVLLPFLYLSRYNHPAADDYFYGVIFSKYDLGKVFRLQYFGWTGRYLMPMIYRLNPACFYSLTGYRVFSFFVILLFAVVTFLVIRSITRGYLGSRQALGLSALLLCLYFSKTPAIPEAFYWFSSYSIYQTANLAMLLLAMALVKLGRRSSPLLVLWSSLLCIVIIGCNEVSLLITVLFFLFFVVHPLVRHRRPAPYLIVLCIVCLVFAIIEIAAPGNFVRLGEHRKTVGSILWTFTGAISITAIYSSQWACPLLAATVLYIPLFGVPIARKMALAGSSFDISFRGFLGFFAGTFCFLLLFIVWATQGSDLGRVFDVIYLFVLLSWFFLVQLLVDKYHPRVHFSPWWGLVLFLASLADINNNVSTAYVDLFSGKANVYDRALSSRAAAARECRTDTCPVPALSDAPRTLFFTDIRPLSDSSGLWIDLYYSRYWHSGFVVPDGPPPVPSSNLEALRAMGRGARSSLLPRGGP